MKEIFLFHFLASKQVLIYTWRGLWGQRDKAQAHTSKLPHILYSETASCYICLLSKQGFSNHILKKFLNIMGLLAPLWEAFH